jgi:leucyl-tRNA synthetase
MAAKKKKVIKKKAIAKKSSVKIKKVLKTGGAVRKSLSKGKKVTARKVVKAAPVKSKAKKASVKKVLAVKSVKFASPKKVARAAETVAASPVRSRKAASKNEIMQAATTKAIQPVKNMALIVPPTPSRKDIVSIKPEPAKAIVPVVEKPAAAMPVKKMHANEEKPRQDKSYNPQTLEKKWQGKWEKDKLYRSVIDNNKPKHYAVTMLPYPSGDLHIGHWYAMTPSDARARYMRMKGYNVLFPMGFDAFGLPAENAAIRDGVHPMKRTFQNIERMRTQMKSMGAMFDWEREVVSASPEYYKWTEWFFIQLYKQGLAYRKMSAVDWCPKDNTTLAREQVWGDDRHCERCGTPVIKKDLEQWFFKATKYADELLNFDGIDWPQTVKTLQTNWIDRSEGAEVQFVVVGPYSSLIKVFTTRPDTLWGATFMVFSPEHPLVDKITTPENKKAVEEYKAQAARQTEIQRGAVDKEKTGVFTGAHAINPVNQARIPIWIADYVMMSYGTGAIMAVPAHDERDFEFARKYQLPIKGVIQPLAADLGKYISEAGKDLSAVFSAAEDGGAILIFDEAEGLFAKRDQAKNGSGNSPTIDIDWLLANVNQAYTGPGVMVSSDPFNGTKVNTDKGRKNPGIAKVLDWVTKEGLGKESVNYRYRDWLISRQRYWGAPIPMIHCEVHGWNPVPDDQLPVLLPEDVEWRPTGESPLKLHPTWKNTTCPVCGGAAVRETDTMDTFMCSSWYHLRYLSPHYDKGPFDPAEYDYWMPVDTYTGGIEHATMHLLYTRFFHKALRDAGIVEGHEPMMQLRNQGMVLGEDGDKMSKSKGNVIAPDVLVDKYGADSVRAYIMFFARWEMGAPWDSKGIEGSVRWVRRVWTLFTDPVPDKPSASAETLKALRRKVHQTLRKVTRDFEKFEFNTIISSLMELMNEMYKAREDGAAGSDEWKEAEEIYLKMMAPVTPHIAEELWSHLGRPYSIHTQKWPEVDEAAAKEDSLELPVQINGKVRDHITVSAEATENEIKSAALASETVQKFLEGREPQKVIVANKRLVSIVV